MATADDLDDAVRRLRMMREAPDDKAVSPESQQQILRMLYPEIGLARIFQAASR